MIRANDIRQYRNYLRTGDKVRIQVYMTPEGDKQTWVSGEIVSIHKHIAMVCYQIPINNLKIYKLTKRIDAVRITDLYRSAIGCQ